MPYEINANFNFFGLPLLYRKNTLYVVLVQCLNTRVQQAVSVFFTELHARAEHALRKFGDLSIRESFVVT